MEEKLKQEVEEKEETVSNKREKSVSEILNQGIILTMKDDIAYLKGEGESVLVQKKEVEERLINMIKAKAGEAARIEEEKKRKKREEIERRERALEKERKEIEEVKTKAKKKEMEVILKKQKELAEEREKEKEKETEEQKRKMEKSRIEEEKIIENIRKRAVEEGQKRKERLADRKRLEEKLKKERIEVEEKLKELLINRSPLEKKKVKLNGNKSMLKDVLKDILKDEVELENRKKSIEQKETEITDPIEKHKVEKERWGVEKKIKEIEQQKWKQLEDISKIEKQIKDIDINLEESVREEDKLREIEKRTIEIQEKMKLEKEKEKIKKEIELYHLQLAPLISQKIELGAKDKQRDKDLRDILMREEEIERKIKVFRSKKQEAGSVEREKEIGEEIWEMEKKRQAIEKDRWEKQKEINKDAGEAREIDSDYQKILVEKEKLEATIAEIDRLLKNVDLPSDKEEVKMEEEYKMQEETKAEEVSQESFSIEKDKESKSEQEQKDIISEIKEKLIAEEKAKSEKEPLSESTTYEEKITEEEQGTEQDQIERKRQKAKEEKERGEEEKMILAKKKILKGLEKISPDEERERERFLNRIKNKQKEAVKQGFPQEEKIFTLDKQKEEIIYRPLPKTQSSQEKILMRILIFLLLVSIVIAIYLLKSKYL